MDMMKHIAAAFDIPATIGEEAQEDDPKGCAEELYGIYAALLAAGFEKPQAWEIFMQTIKTQ
ncbi:MAG: hypothetical protein ACLT0Y_07865 [Christensenellales bacterium]